MSAGSSPKVGWEWKWSNGVGKSEMSIIWCMSITKNVKSNKKTMKQLKRPTSLISHWFPVGMVQWSIMDQNYRTEGNAFFSYWNILLRYPGYAICKLTSRAFWKCNGFPWWDVLNQSYDSKTVVRWDPPPLDHPTIICVFWPENSHILDPSSAIRMHWEGTNGPDIYFPM